MILALIVIALAFAWLLYETDFMRVRLPVGNTPANGKVKPIEKPYKPSRFKPLPMPETIGNTIILCKRC